MQLSIACKDLLKPLQKIIGAVGHKQVSSIQNNLLLKEHDGSLLITATDLEVELVATLEAEFQETQATTVPARKLLDICRSLPGEARLTINSTHEKVEVSSGRSHFVLATFPPEEFPAISDEEMELDTTIVISERNLLYLIEKTSFAVANQDVRYYLNGLLLEVDAEQIKTVATDGHRLALLQMQHETDVEETRQIIIPRKGALELQRLLIRDDNQVTAFLGKNHIRVCLPALQFTSKLIEGRFPNYHRALPAEEGNCATANISLFKHALTRASILSNDKYRGVRLIFNDNKLVIQAHNPEREEAEDEIEIDYQGEKLEVGFNVTYLLDVVDVLETDNVRIVIKDASSSALIVPPGEHKRLYVVMPMRL